jgi:hypothetical protein
MMDAQEIEAIKERASGASVQVEHDTLALVASVEQLQAALRPLVAAWERETATCWGGGPCTCQRVAVVLSRDWMEAAQAAMEERA